MALKVGIDPGSNTNGVAVMVDGVYKSLASMEFMVLMAFADECDRATTEFYVEDPKAMQVPHLDPSEVNSGEYRKMAQNVGQCAGVAKLIIKSLQDKGFKVVPTRPQRGLSKQTKKNKAWFNRLTKWQGNSNEHTRDAAMLIFKYYRG